MPGYKAEVEAFQNAVGLSGDGVVGQYTWDFVKESFMPSRPAFEALSESMKQQLFGDPLGGIPLGEHEDQFIPHASFRPNIVSIEVPRWFRHTGKMEMHRKAVEPLKTLLEAWNKAGLSRNIASFNGSVAFRRIRGGKTLSSHAYGIAFDINSAFNAIGANPALPWQPGCLLELVKIANEHGWFWGGHFRKRCDGMHFELAFA
jgi:hypothetical protein